MGKTILACSVTVAQEFLVLLVDRVRIPAGQPLALSVIGSTKISGVFSIRSSRVEPANASQFSWLEHAIDNRATQIQILEKRPVIKDSPLQLNFVERMKN